MKVSKVCLIKKSTQANNNYIDRANEIIEKGANHGIDKITKKPVTEETVKAAKIGKSFFEFIEKLKKNSSPEQRKKYSEHGPK